MYGTELHYWYYRLTNVKGGYFCVLTYSCVLDNMHDRLEMEITLKNYTILTWIRAALSKRTSQTPKIIVQCFTKNMKIDVSRKSNDYEQN